MKPKSKSKHEKTFYCTLCIRDGLSLKKDVGYCVANSKIGTSIVCRRCLAEMLFRREEESK